MFHNPPPPEPHDRQLSGSVFTLLSALQTHQLLPPPPAAPRRGFLLLVSTCDTESPCPAGWKRKSTYSALWLTVVLDDILSLLSRGMLKYCTPTSPPPLPLLKRTPAREGIWGGTYGLSCTDQPFPFSTRPHVWWEAAGMLRGSVRFLFFFSPQFFSFVMFYAAAPSWSLWYFSLFFFFFNF